MDTFKESEPIYCHLAGVQKRTLVTEAMLEESQAGTTSGTLPNKCADCAVQPTIDGPRHLFVSDDPNDHLQVTECTVDTTS